jgi:hypothetical protein
MRLLAAALTLSAIALVVACGSDGGSAPQPTSTGGAAMNLEVPAGSPEALVPGAYIASNFEPEASFRAGEGWSAAVVDTALIALIRTSPEADCLCIIHPDGVYDPAGGAKTDLPADLTAWLQEHPGIETTKASSVQVGNRAARQMEARVAAGATLVNGRLPLFAAGDQTYSMAPGERGHIIVIDHPAGSLIIAVRVPEAELGDYFGAVETVVGSLGFGG